ncbi:MAG: RNA polymerase sigma factor [Verrucomicrobia subdivision 3 bacterium]|nr:RNA polymerase sigma factor [Limisphaerales bacterium]
MLGDSERLCEGAQAGDMAAASQLIALHYEKIFCYFRRLSGSDEDGEDLTQKTFLKVWSSINSFQGRSSFSTWIHGIAHNVYVDWRRKRSVTEFQSADWWEGCIAEGPSPFEDTTEREMARQLYACVEQLDEESKQAVHLHYYQGLSLKETAEVLNIATSTLKYRLREALEFLRSQTAESKFRTK